ncbi:MAG: hypothetical protein M0R06_20270 [Sphaerochaeta sp.]|nr:hypothetical protein [Sphaerochaeta sp.]
MAARSEIEKRIRERIEVKKNEFHRAENLINVILDKRRELEAQLTETTVRAEAIREGLIEDEALLASALPKRQRRKKTEATDDE